jgi:hypothetical protein
MFFISLADGVGSEGAVSWCNEALCWYSAKETASHLEFSVTKTS